MRIAVGFQPATVLYLVYIVWNAAPISENKETPLTAQVRMEDVVVENESEIRVEMSSTARTALKQLQVAKKPACRAYDVPLKTYWRLWRTQPGYFQGYAFCDL